MKKSIASLSLFAFLLTTLHLTALAGPTSIRVAPPAPKIADAERHAELARRRAAVAAKMVDKSIQERRTTYRK